MMPIDFEVNRTKVKVTVTLCTGVSLLGVSLLYKRTTCSTLYSATQTIFINSLPNDKILDWSKLKAFADDKINVNKKLKFGLEKEENFVEKGENAGYQHFLLFPQCFQQPSFLGSLKVRIVW